MDDFLFNVLKLVLIIVVMLITRYAIPWLQKNTKIAENKMLADIAEVAVRYGEQVFQSPCGGATRKEIVTRYIKEQLRAKDISISDEQIEALIEAAVYTMNNEKIRVEKESEG